MPRWRWYVSSSLISSAPKNETNVLVGSHHLKDQQDAIPASQLERETLALYDQGLYLDAYNLVEANGGLAALAGASGQSIAGRLASNLGASRFGSSIHLRAWRRYPQHETLVFFAAMSLSTLWGPLRILRMLDTCLQQTIDARAISDIASARVYQLAGLRDFGQAEQALEQGFQAEPDRPWMFVTKGSLLQRQDRNEESIVAYRAALERRPLYRPAIQALAAALVQKNQVEEARAILIDAHEKIQCGYLPLQLAQIDRELGEYQRAKTRLEEAIPLLPLRKKDRGTENEFAGFAATLAYDLGEFDEAIRLSQESDTKFHKTVAQNVSHNRETGRRVILDVGFTLQHDVTCVPATLATLSKYWGKPLQHLDIAEAICYDGTPAHAERAWLEQQGFFCREFTLTWETAIALIDAGLPFTQTLTGYNMGHVQAVIGYDSRMGVLIYRDPNVRHAGQVLANELLEQMRSTGPRGMVFLPHSEKARIEAIELPDAILWDDCHAVTTALSDHRREDAITIYQSMQDKAPAHRLTNHVRARIANYDGDLRKLHQLTDRLLEEFPNDQNQWSVKLRLLRQLGSRSDRLEVLENLCDKPDCEIVYRQQLIDELLTDPNERHRIDYLLRRSMRDNPFDPQLYTLQAHRAWADKDREQALQWSRYAACLDARSEDRSATYFSAARALNRTDEAMAMLTDRFDRMRSQDCGPGISLVDALDQVHKQERALDVLDSALDARPDDGDLLLYACSFRMKLGRIGEAQQHLCNAEGKCHHAYWLAASARLAEQENRFEDAYNFLTKSLERSPLNIATHHQIVHVLTEGRGVEAAIDHLTRYIERFPKNYDLSAVLVGVSAKLDGERAESAARDHLKLHPEDAWCWRELGFILCDQRRWQEAQSAAQSAEEIEPQQMQNYLLRGMIHTGLGDYKSARGQFVKAIRISVDYEAAIIELMRLCDSQQERQDALAEILAQLKCQVIAGETLQTIRAYATTAYEPQQALKFVQEAHTARPDLWTAWSTLIAQYLAMKHNQDALRVAQAAVQQFPLLPGALIDLAKVYQAMGNTKCEIEQLEQALEINSRASGALRDLAESYARSGDFKRERAALERACESEPNNVTHRGALAEFHWRLGEREQAIETIRGAITAEPEYEWGWDKLSEWVFTSGEPELLVELAGGITKVRPQSPQAWLQKSEVLASFPDRAHECLKAIQKALELDNRHVAAHESHAIFLAQQGLFDQAIAACDPLIFQGVVPLRLRARAAIIESQRGELDTAITRMKEVLKDDPHYAYAWSQLSAWQQHQGDTKEALTSAKRLLDLAPRSPASWGYVADCLHAEGEIEDCKRHLQKAIELDSSYLYGGNMLLQLQAESKDYDDALRTLNTISPHLSDYQRAALEAKLCTLANRQEQAFHAMRHACGYAADSDDLLLETMEAMQLGGWAEPLKQLLHQELEAGNATPKAISILVELLSREGQISTIENLCSSIDETSPHWVEAACTYLGILGNAHATKLIEAFLSPRLSALRQHTSTWWKVGSALWQDDQLTQAINWMDDWKQRDNLEPHHLAPLVMANMQMGDFSKASAIVDYCNELTLSPATDTLRVIGAGAEVFAGKSEVAAERLESISPQSLSEYYYSWYALIKTATSAANSVQQGVRWRDAWAHWNETLQLYANASQTDLFKALISYCQLLLIRRGGNPLKIWIAERKARQHLKGMKP